MLVRNLVPCWILLGLGWFAAESWSIPVPKEKPDSKPSEEEAVTPNEAVGIIAACNRVKSSNNLKEFADAVHNFAAGSGKGFFPRNIPDKDGKPLLSWRVQLLPFLEQGELYKQFKFDEPWDSKNNLELLDKMPKVFESPRTKVKKKGYTVYQGFEGNGAVFGSGYGLPNIPDGTSNTILFVESSSAVPWTKPVNLPFDPKKDLPDFGKAYDGKPLAALCDGSVRVLDLKKIKPETLKNAIQTNDGNVLGEDWNP